MDNKNKKTKGILQRTIALVLICVMVFNLFPSIVIGIRDTQDEETVQDITIPDFPTEEEPEIIGEDISKRKLNEKHFMLEDGTMLLAMYPEDVHYEKDGKLEEIDNTLKEVNGVYENTANSFKSSFEKTAQKDKLAQIDVNGFEISWSLQETEKEELKEHIIENGVVEKENLKKENIENENIEKENIEKENIENKDFENELSEIDKEKTIEEINTVEAQIPQIQNKLESKSIENKDETELNNLNSRIEYNNIIEDVDLKYDIISNGIKESIIINNKEAIQDSFIFMFDIGSLTAELTEENKIIIYNSNKEDIVCLIETPYMFDDNFEYSYDIDVKLEKVDNLNENNKYKVTITPSKEWLEDENRIYPVSIDPTVITSQMRNKIQDTYIYNGDTGNTTKGNAHITRIGNSKWLSGGNPARGLIKFELPELNAGDQVIYAGLSIFNYNKTSEWAPPTRQMQLDVHKMTANWEENNAYWNNLSNSYDSKIVDYILYQFDYNNPSTCYQQWFDITSIAKDWYTTGNNYGLMIKEHNEIMGYTAESDMYFVSSDTHSAYYDARPMVTIEYRNQTGIEDYLSYHIQDMGRSGVVYTNDYNGNVVWMHEDASTPGSRLPATVSHVYNTNDINQNIGYGNGLRLNLSQSIKPVSIGGTNYLEYVDEDGTRHYFTNNNGVWKDEDGLSLEVTFNNDTYTMTDKNGNKAIFTHLFRYENIWCLCKLEDANGNNINIEFLDTANNNTIIKKVTDATGQSINLQYSGTTLTGITDSAGRQTQFFYNSVGGIDHITYPDGNTSWYDFAGNMLYGINKIDGSTIRYEYYQEPTRRLKSIKEYSSGNELGNTLEITYSTNLTIFKDNKGYTNNINFNDFGQAISISDFGKEGDNIRNAYGKNYEYGENEGSKNKLTLEGKLICSDLIEGNILPNKNFDYGPNGTGLWTGWNTNANDKAYFIDGTTALGLTGEGTVDKNMYQDVPTSGQKGDVLKFSAWVKANGVDVREDLKCTRMVIAINKTDGQTQWNHTYINADSNGWQYVTQETIAEGPYNSVRVYLSYTYNANTTYFTNVTLTKEEGGNSYTYDANGNIISSQNLAKENSTFEYDGKDQLIKSTNPKGGSFTYQYDANIKNRLLNAVTATGIKYSFEYDNYGNAVKSKISESETNTGKYMETTAEYTADGNYLTALSDQKGNETTYTYNEQTGTTTKVTDAKGNETNYEYDSLDRVTKISQQVGTKKYENLYTYVKDNISTIVHNGFSYSFLYDNFGNVSQVKVGDQTLITNNYESNNGNLTSAEYGNGQIISYLYDRFNRTTKKTGTDGSHEYTYNAKSNLDTYKDNVNNETSTYEYDFADRLIKILNTNGFSSQYGYDENSNVNNIKYTLNNVINQILYTFDKDNRITNIKLNENVEITTNYDTLSRLDNKELKVNDNTYNTEYEYEDTETANKTTTSLKSIKNGTNDEISYTYDDLGNIETIKEGNTLKAKYYYDELSQLIREDNGYLNKTIVYEYDLGGNITTKTEYPYTTTSELGTATNTINYTYNNTNWKDQLTNYDGKEITYDNIGNVISYGDNTYTWQNGRQLASIINDPTVKNLGENFDANKVLITLSGDFNNDNKKDIAVLYNCGNNQIKIIVWLKTETGFSEGQVWYDSGINELNPSLIQDRIALGDFNGDGKADIGTIYDAGNGQTQTYVFLSDGEVFEKQLWSTSQAGSIDINRLDGRVVAGDFTGDGKDDIAGIYDYGNGSVGIAIWRSEGEQFKSVSIWNKTGVGTVDAGRLTGRVVSGDFNGDGICDIAGIYNYQNASTGVVVWQGVGNSFNSSVWNRTGEGVADANKFTERVISLDYNGDGKDDIAGIYEYPDGSSKIFVWISQTTSFSTFMEKYNIGTRFSISQLTNKIVSSDYNGDGKDDIGLLTNENGKGVMYSFNSTDTLFESPTTLWSTDNVISFKYNDNGIRTSKIVGGIETKYYLDGNNVIYEKTGEDITYYSYDESGQIIGINRNGTQYYYIKNAQNDIIGILDNNLQQIVSYTYTSWGELISIKDASGNEITDLSNIGLINPYLYRSYRYDRETGYYYLNSRYYNPEWGRFLNADGMITGSLVGNNLYSYCGNNPVNMYDPDGYFLISLTGLICKVVVVVVGIIVATEVAVGVAKVADLIASQISQGSSSTGTTKNEPVVTTATTDPNSSKEPNDKEFEKRLDNNTKKVKDGYTSFGKLKKAIGSAGEGKDWHHIVEQCQIKRSGFDVRMIQNEKNVIAIDRKTHRKISAHYSSIRKGGNGLTVRDWLQGQSYQAQYDYGIQVLKMFGVI